MYCKDCKKNSADKPMCPVMEKGQCPMDKIHKYPMMANCGYGSYQMPNMPMMGKEVNKNLIDERQIEMMYPHSYYVIYPHVRYKCDLLERKYGKNYCPTKEEMKDIVEDICKKVEKELEKDVDDKKDKDQCRAEDRRRRRRYDRRRLLNDLVGVILIGELLNRRGPYYGPGYWY